MEAQRGIHIRIPEQGKDTIYGIADIVVRRGDGSVAVLDTKYKDPGPEGWVIGDVDQMAAYCAAAPSA